MPWTNNDYPASMKNLPVAVREKAIEIANALLDEQDIDEGIAIATGISRAKDWAANRGLDTESTSDESKTTDVKEHGEDRYVIPYDGKWAVRSESSERVERIFDHKIEAVRYGRTAARKSNASLTIQKKSGRVQQRISYNPNRRARKLK
ncbi:MAG TPA: DUF2188 domain-containing protein [Chryseolinea sp.]|nr:DUF2188 domain-containing protein [Chryseolinea sp.]